jgi:hypothetical protein
LNYAPVAQLDRVLGYEPLKKPLKTFTVKHSCKMFPLLFPLSF